MMISMSRTRSRALHIHIYTDISSSRLCPSCTNEDGGKDSPRQDFPVSMQVRICVCEL